MEYEFYNIEIHKASFIYPILEGVYLISFTFNLLVCQIFDNFKLLK